MTYPNIDRVFTYQNENWHAYSKSVEYSNLTTLSGFDSNYGYWIYANPIYQLSASGSTVVTLSFSISSLGSTTSASLSLWWSSDSGESWAEARSYSGTTQPLSNSSQNQNAWDSTELSIQTSSVILKLIAVWNSKSASAYVAPSLDTAPLSYPVVHTNQSRHYDHSNVISTPGPGEAFYGQDPLFSNHLPSYTDHGDGTVTDNITGLMWQKAQGGEISYEDARDGASTFQLAGYTDWRLPTIKELYSLILFSGQEGTNTIVNGGSTSLDAIPFIDHSALEFEFISKTDRYIDLQTWSSTEYVSFTMHRDETVFGVNFADGRIKGYPKVDPRTQQPFNRYVRYVRGRSDYGANNFEDPGDGKIIDHATGLEWMKADSGSGMIWEDALNYCQNLELAGNDDWRLPHIKELHSILDYGRSPDTTNSAAIDPIFSITSITESNGAKNYPNFWSTTSHINQFGAARAAYIAFGEALGWMQDPFRGQWELLDVHGAGAQRSDPKEGDPNDYPQGHGPQGDVITIFNFVRCVR